MRTLYVITAVSVAALCAGGAQAQFGIEENPDLAIEQLLLFRLAQEAQLDSYSLAEMLEGYAMYREGMDTMEAERAKLKSEIEDAVSGGQAGYELTDKLNALMEVDSRILRTKQEAIQEAGSLLGAAAEAQLYLIVSDFDTVASSVRAALAPEPLSVKDGTETAEVGAAVEVVSDEETILEGVKAFSAQMAAKDIEGAMAAVADDFNHYEYGDKEGLKQFLLMAADMGYLDDIEISSEDAKVTFEDNGEKATVKPLEVEGTFGFATLTLYVGRVGGEWKLVGIDIYGI